MLGREAQGIALLNQVYDEFLDQKSYDHAAQCLANIATYYEKTEQKAKASRGRGEDQAIGSRIGGAIAETGIA